jgi:hypothetical protein
MISILSIFGLYFSLKFLRFIKKIKISCLFKSEMENNLDYELKIILNNKNIKIKHLYKKYLKIHQE